MTQAVSEGPHGQHQCGEWVVRLAADSVSVTAGSRRETSLTLIQSVDDWRGALWEGRGSVFGRQLSDLLRRTADAAGSAASAGASALASLAEFARLDGVIRVVVTDGPGGDWATAIKLGPGEIPPEATTTVRISAADAAALGRGELDALQAFMTGRIRVTGNMLLMLQMQAIGMRAVSGAGRAG